MHKQRQSDEKENSKDDVIPVIQNVTTEPTDIMNNSGDMININTEPIFTNKENENMLIYVAERIPDEKKS